MSGWRLSRGVSCVNFWILAGLGGSGGGQSRGSGGPQVRASVRAGGLRQDTGHDVARRGRIRGVVCVPAPAGRPFLLICASAPPVFDSHLNVMTQ
jgi:hypothetical protein